VTESLRTRAGRAAGWQAAQHAAVQAIYFVRLLILAHLLAPDAFGLLAIATVAISVLVRISDFGMIPALIQRADATAEQYDAAWSLNVLRGFAIAACFAFAGPTVARLFGEPAAGPIVSVLALRVAIDALASIELARLTRDLRFRDLARIRVPPAVLDTIVALALASRLGVWALVAGALAGAAASTALSWAVAPRRLRFRLRAADLAPLVRFGRWILLIGILSLAGSSVSQAAISRTLGAARLGMYYLAARIAFLPAEAVAAVVRPVAFPVFAQAADRDRAANAFRTLLMAQAALLFPVCALVVALAPALESALGGRWLGTAPVIRVLALASAIGLYGDTVGPVLMGRGAPHRVALIEAIQSFVWLAALLPLLAGFGVTGAALAWLAANTVAQAVAWLAIRRFVPAPGGLRTRVLMIVVVAAAGGIVARFTALAIPGLGGLIVAGVAAMLVAGYALLRVDRALDLGLAKLVPRSLPGTMAGMGRRA
jgi:O-antigen/teichoic acid export membrane protein